MKKGGLTQGHSEAVRELSFEGPGWIKSVAVYCGSRVGNHDEYVMEAYKLGYMLAENGFGVIFGGGDSGLMGVVKEGALKYNLARGIKDGVVEYNPAFFHGGQGIGGEGVVTHTVPDVYERKKEFISQSQLSIALGGGVGTGDEVFDVMIAADISPYATPDKAVPQVILVDTQGLYSEGLKPYFDRTFEVGFTMRDRVEQVMSIVDDAQAAIDKIKSLNAQPALMPHQLLRKHSEHNTDYNAVLNRNADAMNAFLAERGEKPLFGQSDDQPVQSIG